MLSPSFFILLNSEGEEGITHNSQLLVVGPQDAPVARARPPAA